MSSTQANTAEITRHFGRVNSTKKYQPSRRRAAGQKPDTAVTQANTTETTRHFGRVNSTKLSNGVQHREKIQCQVRKPNTTYHK